MGHKKNLVNHIDMRWSFEVRVRHGKTLGFELLYLVKYLILSINNHCLSLDICSCNQLYMLVIWLRMLTNMKSEENKKPLTSSYINKQRDAYPSNSDLFAETPSVPAQLHWRVPNFRASNARAVGRRWGLTCQLREVEDDSWYNLKCLFGYK